VVELRTPRRVSQISAWANGTAPIRLRRPTHLGFRPTPFERRSPPDRCLASSNPWNVSGSNRSRELLHAACRQVFDRWNANTSVWLPPKSVRIGDGRMPGDEVRRLLHHPHATARVITDEESRVPQHVRARSVATRLEYVPELAGVSRRYRDPSRSSCSSPTTLYQSLPAPPGAVMIHGQRHRRFAGLTTPDRDRDKYRLQTTILHLFRTYVGAPTVQHLQTPKGKDGWHTGIHYRVGWGGHSRRRSASSRARNRKRAYKEMGGTNTPVRKRLAGQLRRAAPEGWYHVMPGRRGPAADPLWSTTHGRSRPQPAPAVPAPTHRSTSQ